MFGLQFYSVICTAVIFTVDLDIIYPMWKSKSKHFFYILEMNNNNMLLALKNNVGHNYFFTEMDLLPWFATFSVSLLVGLEYGVLIGFFISVIFILYYAARPGCSVRRGQVKLYHLNGLYVY